MTEGDDHPGGDLHPRVLVVAAAPLGFSTGTGTTLSNLFGDWPPDRLAQLYLTGQEYVNQSYCSYFYSPRNTPVDYYTRRLLKWRGRSLVQGAPAIGAVPPGETGRSMTAALHRQLRAIADLSPLRMSPSLLEWLRNYRPDVVYSPLGSVRIMRLAARIARQCRRPIVPHFMDDWPRTLYSSGELFGHALDAVDSSLRDVISLSRCGVCISWPMAEEYRERYRLPLTVFVNCVDDSAFGDPKEITSKTLFKARTLRLVYVGGLHLGRWRSLMDIAHALEGLGVGGPKPQLFIYAPKDDIARYREAFLGPTTVRVAGPIAGREVSKVLSDADLLVHVESFDENIRRYTRLSVSTKIPQYMAAGRPIFAYGPPDLASMRHISTAKAGIVAGENDSRSLAALLESVCANIAQHRELGYNGYLYAAEHHRKRVVAAEFVEFLRTAGTKSLEIGSMSGMAFGTSGRADKGMSVPGPRIRPRQNS